jgi:hypothetical protein
MYRNILKIWEERKNRKKYERKKGKEDKNVSTRNKSFFIRDTEKNEILGEKRNQY